MKMFSLTYPNGHVVIAKASCLSDMVLVARYEEKRTGTTVQIRQVAYARTGDSLGFTQHMNNDTYKLVQVWWFELLKPLVPRSCGVCK